MARAGMSPQLAGLTLLAASEVPNFLAGMAPSLFTLSHMSGKSGEHQAEAKASMRRAYVVGGGLSLAVGAGASLVGDANGPSWWPFLITVVVFAILVFQYEHALNHPHNTAEEMFTG